MTWQDAPRAAYTRFRTLPVVWQGAALVLALVALLWLYGALDGAISHARDWFTDRELIELQQEADALRLKNYQLEGQLVEVRAQKAAVDAAFVEKQIKIDALAERGEQEDAQVIPARKRYESTRRGTTRRPDDGRWPDADLRDLYGPDPQR
jgi:hypothetical protein